MYVDGEACVVSTTAALLMIDKMVGYYVFDARFLAFTYELDHTVEGRKSCVEHAIRSVHEAIEAAFKTWSGKDYPGRHHPLPPTA